MGNLKSLWPLRVLLLQCKAAQHGILQLADRQTVVANSEFTTNHATNKMPLKMAASVRRALVRMGGHRVTSASSANQREAVPAE